MCGAFIALATGRLSGEQGGWRRDVQLQASYHAGRLLTYVALGAAAGAAGGLLNLTGALAGLRTFATVLAAITLTGMGITWLLRATGVRAGIARSAPWMPFVQKLHRRAMNYPPAGRAFLIGLMTTLLPCGWLYAFAVTAAGTGSALNGSIVMTVFWAGTLPAMAAVGAGARRLLGQIAQRMPVVTSLVVIAAGVYTLVARAGFDPTTLARHTHVSAAPNASEAACCVDGHGGGK